MNIFLNGIYKKEEKKLRDININNNDNPDLWFPDHHHSWIVQELNVARGWFRKHYLVLNQKPAAVLIYTHRTPQILFKKTILYTLSHFQHNKNRPYLFLAAIKAWISFFGLVGQRKTKSGYQTAAARKKNSVEQSSSQSERKRKRGGENFKDRKRIRWICGRSS